MEPDCLARFGEARGRQIYALTEGIYKTLCAKAEQQSSEATKAHMLTNLYPTMAYYKALREFGYDAEVALAFVKAETAKSAQLKRRKNERLAALPCTYLLFRLFIKSVMKKSFPAEGWDTEWVCRNAKGLHFDFTRCLYKDCCDEEHCPELCCVFCANDDLSFCGLMPKNRFERSGTLGRGSARLTIASGSSVLYAGNGTAASDFTLSIPRDGNYTVTLDAHHAAGKVSIR